MSKEAMKLALEALDAIIDAIYVNSAQEADAVVKANDAAQALREALAEQPAQQEPVAWMTKDGEIYKHECWPEHEARPLVFGDTSPPAQRKPLPDEEIKAASLQAGMQEHYMGFHSGFIRFARAIEAAHGIKEKT